MIGAVEPIIGTKPIGRRLCDIPDVGRGGPLIRGGPAREAAAAEEYAALARARPRG